MPTHFGLHVVMIDFLVAAAGTKPETPGPIDKVPSG
jgi:hypothetical protein